MKFIDFMFSFYQSLKIDINKKEVDQPMFITTEIIDDEDCESCKI